MIAKIKLYVIAALAFLAAIVTFGQLKKREGRKYEQSKRTSERLDGIKAAQEIEKEIADADKSTVVDINTKP